MFIYSFIYLTIFVLMEQHIEIYIINVTKIASENDGYRYAVTGVDIFSKYGWAMPIKTKQPHDVLIGLKEVLD